MAKHGTFILIKIHSMSTECKMAALILEKKNFILLYENFSCLFRASKLLEPYLSYNPYDSEIKRNLDVGRSIWDLNPGLAEL